MTVRTLMILGESAYESLTRAALLLAAIFALTAIVIAVARRYRGRAAEDNLDRHQMMSNFRDLYDRGGLSDEEFRTIKAKLASELKAELRDNSGSG
jgi:preprotein translocase subunit SecG